MSHVGYADDLEPLDAYPLVADAENRPIANKTFIHFFNIIYNLK